MIFAGTSAAQEKSVFQMWQSYCDWPLLASRQEHIKFIELRANEDPAGIIPFCRPMPGFSADADLKTQYVWAKAWHKVYFERNCAEDNEQNEENRQGAGFHDEDILTEECVKGADNVSTAAVAVHRTPPTARKALGDSDAAQSRRKRRYRATPMSTRFWLVCGPNRRRSS